MPFADEVPAALTGPDAPPLPAAGRAALQVLPSGPDERVEAIAQVVLMAVYAATRDKSPDAQLIVDLNLTHK